MNSITSIVSNKLSFTRFVYTIGISGSILGIVLSEIFDVPFPIRFWYVICGMFVALLISSFTPKPPNNTVSQSSNDSDTRDVVFQKITIDTLTRVDDIVKQIDKKTGELLSGIYSILSPKTTENKPILSLVSKSRRKQANLSPVIGTYPPEVEVSDTDVKPVKPTEVSDTDVKPVKPTEVSDTDVKPVKPVKPIKPITIIPTIKQLTPPGSVVDPDDYDELDEHELDMLEQKLASQPGGSQSNGTTISPVPNILDVDDDPDSEE